MKTILVNKMKKKNDKNKPIALTLRRSWGDLNPATKVIPNKKKSEKIKHKKILFENQED